MTTEPSLKMNINFEKWADIIRKGIAPFDIILTEQQIRLFYKHAEELVQWTRNVNLTAITDPKEIAIKHFIDSLGPSSFLTPMKHVLDVGSGGGFPGMPLKVLYPNIELTLVDAVRKKISFMQHVIRKLELKGARAIHARVENLNLRDDFTPFDTIVCRAFSDLSVIIPHALPLLSQDGKIVVWKGRVPEKEILDFRRCFREEALLLTIEVQSYRLPIIDAERSIVRITKIDNS